MRLCTKVALIVAITLGLIAVGLPVWAADDSCCAAKAADTKDKAPAKDKAAAKNSDKASKKCGPKGDKGICKSKDKAKDKDPDKSSAKTPKNLKIGGSVETRVNVKSN